MISQEDLESIKNIALFEAKEPTFDSWYRSLCRWFSREFSTPLIEVLNYPHEFILKTYYEDSFYKLASGSDEEKKLLEEAITDAIKGSLSAEEVKEMDDSDEEWYKQELEAIENEFSKNKVVEVNEEIPIDDIDD